MRNVITNRSVGTPSRHVCYSRNFVYYGLLWSKATASLYTVTQSLNSKISKLTAYARV
jgi:hypothetical protein